MYLEIICIDVINYGFICTSDIYILYIAFIFNIEIMIVFFFIY